MTSQDVVVVGGRVAGASTALLLARAGLRIALVDRGRRGSDTLSTHALMRACVVQLARWEVLARMSARAPPPSGAPSSTTLRDADLLAHQEAARESLARYQATRERLSRGPFEATEAVAAHDWDADGIRTLLHRVSSAMGDEVEHLDGLTGVPVAT